MVRRAQGEPGNREDEERKGEGEGCGEEREREEEGIEFLSQHGDLVRWRLQYRGRNENLGKCQAKVRGGGESCPFFFLFFNEKRKLYIGSSFSFMYCNVHVLNDVYVPTYLCT